MDDFVSQPPNKQLKPLSGFFIGGMMPATNQDLSALIVFDIRSVRLSVAEGKQLETKLREVLFSELAKIRKLHDLENRSAVDLSTSVFGIAIE